MAAAPLPPEEKERLRALRALEILDTPPERGFDDIARIAAFLMKTPIALVSLVDEDRQWFKARFGLEVAETPREDSFCAHAILDVGVTHVRDARCDERFRDNPLVVGAPGIRFYAGAPLRTAEGHAIGSLPGRPASGSCCPSTRRDGGSRCFPRTPRERRSLRSRWSREPW